MILLLLTTCVWSEPEQPPALPPPPPAIQEPEQFPTVDISTYFTFGSYNTGGSSSGLSEYFQYYFEPGSKIYVGHSTTTYNNTGAFQDGLRQQLNNIGTLIQLDEKNFLNLDYFNLSDNQGGTANLFSVEFDHSFDPSLTAGLAINSSSYPGYSVQQIIPRIIWWPDESISLNSRIYVTTSSLTSTKVCLSEKLSYFPSPQWELQVGGVLGSSLNRIDNDTSVVYTQTQVQNGSFFAGVGYKPIQNLKLDFCYEKAFFQGYLIDYFKGGASIRF